MIESCLNEAIAEIENLIEFTKEDIALIKSAKHKDVIERVSKKEHLLKRFEIKKAKLNSELQREVELSNRSVEEIISKDQSFLLDEFKKRLLLLKELNRDFMAIVVVVREFYQSLFNNIFSVDELSYNASKASSASILKVSA